MDLRLDVAGDPDEVVDDGLLVGVHRLVHLLRLELRVRVDLLHDVVLRPHELGLVLAKLKIIFTRFTCKLVNPLQSNNYSLRLINEIVDPMKKYRLGSLVVWQLGWSDMGLKIIPQSNLLCS